MDTPSRDACHTVCIQYVCHTVHIIHVETKLRALFNGKICSKLTSRIHHRSPLARKCVTNVQTSKLKLIAGNVMMPLCSVLLPLSIDISSFRFYIFPQERTLLYYIKHMSSNPKMKMLSAFYVLFFAASAAAFAPITTPSRTATAFSVRNVPFV